MLVVQRLGSGPQSMDKFYSHKAHKQKAMVPKAPEHGGFAGKRWSYLETPLNHPVSLTQSFLETIHQGCYSSTSVHSTLFSLRFSKILWDLYCTVYPSTSLCRVWFRLGGHRTQPTIPSPGLMQIQQEGWVVVKSQPCVSLFRLLPMTGPDFTHWWLAPWKIQCR